MPVGSDPPIALTEKVFGLYRQLGQAREDCERQLGAVRNESDESHRQLRRRLADLGAEVFYLRRCVASLEGPLRQAGLEREIKRLELLLKRFDQALRDTGVQVESLDGRDLDDALAELIEVTGHFPAEVQTARVHETLDPLVTVDGQVLRFAKVISAVPAHGES